jgi:excisionase family DNA binding protein
LEVVRTSHVFGKAAGQGLLSVKDVASFLGVSPCTVYRLVEKREVPSIKGYGLGIRFKKEDIDAWLEERKSRPCPKFDVTGLTMSPGITMKRSCGRTGGTCEMAKANSKSRYNFGFGAIYQRKRKSGSVRWYLDYWDASGKRVQRVADHASSKEEAYEALKSAVLAEHQRGLGITAVVQKIRFSEFSQMYLTNYAKLNKRSWRDDQYRLDAKMVPYFGKLELQEITPLEIEKYRARRLDEGVTRSTWAHSRFKISPRLMPV